MASLQKKNSANHNGHRSLPEVADPATETPGCEDVSRISPNDRLPEDEFKVFLKKTLTELAAPSDLLTNIYARIDTIEID